MKLFTSALLHLAPTFVLAGGFTRSCFDAEVFIPSNVNYASVDASCYTAHGQILITEVELNDCIVNIYGRLEASI